MTRSYANETGYFPAGQVQSLVYGGANPYVRYQDIMLDIPGVGTVEDFIEMPTSGAFASISILPLGGENTDKIEVFIKNVRNEIVHKITADGGVYSIGAFSGRIFTPKIPPWFSLGDRLYVRYTSTVPAAPFRVLFSPELMLSNGVA